MTNKPSNRTLYAARTAFDAGFNLAKDIFTADEMSPEEAAEMGQRYVMVVLPFITKCPFTASFLNMIGVNGLTKMGEIIDSINTHIGKHGFRKLDPDTDVKDVAIELDQFLEHLDDQGIKWVEDSDQIVERLDS